MNVVTKVDISGLKAGIMASRKYSRRSLPESINSALYHAAVDAQARTRFVEPETINSELAAKVTPVLGVSGKPLKSKKAFTVSANVKTAAGKDAPLAVLIIQKLAREGGTLGKGFPLRPGMFKGIPRALAAQKMAAFVDRLIKNRRRSTHFLAAGWRDAIEALKKVVVSSIRGQKQFGGQGLGSATPAVEGDTVYAEIENNVGAEGPHAASANRALHVYGGAALQAALDHEGKTRLEMAMKKSEQELAQTVKPHWG